MANVIRPTLEHELSSIRMVSNVNLPDFGLLKKQCIAFGEFIPQPVDSINQVSGYEPRYLQKINEKKLNIPTPVQSHLWPILFRGRSATCISAPKSGKTLAYLIPALSDTHFKYEDPDQLIYGDEGPRVVVVCSGVNKVFAIRDHITNILDGTKSPRTLIVHKDNESSITVKLLNGCDVLISTPGPLKRLVESEYVRFDICGLLVFDDADRSFTLHPAYVKPIVLSYLKSYRKRLNLSDDLEALLTAPMLVLADSWTKEVKNFATQYMKNSVQIFGDLFEAAIAHNLVYEIRFAPTEEKRLLTLSDLVHSILNPGQINRIAIVCSNDAESAKVTKAMEDLDVIPVALDSSKYNYELPKLLEMIRSHPRAITIITDDKIKEVPQINFIDSLVHYTMPDHSDIFRSRFLLMSELIKKEEGCTKTYLILSPINGNHAHFLCQSLRRLGDVPAQLEQLRSVSTRKICEYYMAFASCPFKSTFCLNRHHFKMTERPNKSLPVDGQVRFQITHIISINQFYIRFNEYRDGRSEDGSWTKYAFQYEEIEQQLQSFKEGAKPDEKIPKIGKIYGLVVVGVVHRVQVVENLGQLTVQETNMPVNEETPYNLEVFFIDLGYHSKALSDHLIELPKQLREYPSLAFKTYLLGINPADNEIEWTHKPAEILSFFLREHNNLIGSAWIRLQRKKIFWIDNMKIVQNLRHVSRSVVSWSPQYDLIDAGLVVKNDKMFSKVNTNLHELFYRWNNYRLMKSIDRAFLSDDLELVYLSHFKSFDHFYVQKLSDFKCLENLEKDLSKLKLTPMQVFITGTLGIGKIKLGAETNYSRMKLINYSAEDKLVEAFFVDWGEIYQISTDDCFTIEERFIKRLPFQAIKCSLTGIEGTADPDKIYDLTRYPEGELLKKIIVEKLNGSKEHGYTVRLWVETKETIIGVYFHLFSKLLVDQGFANYTDSTEKDQEVQRFMPRPQVIEDDDDDSDDAIARGEKKCLENLLSHVSEGMKQFLIENMKSDSIQFDPKKITRRTRLMLQLKRIKEEEKKANGNADGNSVDHDDHDDHDDCDNYDLKNKDSEPRGPIDYSQVLPYDPDDSDESELESDLEGFEEDISEF